MTLAIPACRTAASNGNSCSSRSSRGADVGRRLVEPALGQPVADHVLAGRDHALGEVRALEGLDVGAARAPRRGTGPRRRSPRSGPSAGRARCRGPARARAGRRSGASGGGSSPPSPRRRRGRSSRRRRSTAGSTARPRRSGRAGTPRGRSPGSRAASPRRGSRWICVGRLGDLDRPQVGGTGQPRDLADAVPGQLRPAGRRRGRSRRRPRTPRTTRAGRASPRGSSARGGRRRARRSAGDGSR